MRDFIEKKKSNISCELSPIISTTEQDIWLKLISWPKMCFTVILFNLINHFIVIVPVQRVDKDGISRIRSIFWCQNWLVRMPLKTLNMNFDIKWVRPETIYRSDSFDLYSSCLLLINHTTYKFLPNGFCTLLACSNSVNLLYR